METKMETLEEVHWLIISMMTLIEQYQKLMFLNAYSVPGTILRISC